MLAARRLPPLQPVRALVRPRRYSSRAPDEPLELAYEIHEPPKDSPAPASRYGPIVFLHGLFGSRQNNRTMSKILARDLNRPVYNLDLRNHGASPHHPVHTYTAMATDIEHFLATHALSRVALIGHSMGAKTAMAVALRSSVSSPAPIAQLVSIDNAPLDSALQSPFALYVRSMRALTASSPPISKLSDADRALAASIPEPAVRQFLLTNLVRAPGGGAAMGWRIPLDVLGREMPHMADFPFGAAGEVRWEGPTLVVRGTRSKYVPDEALPVVGAFFPRFRVVDVQCGHWVVSERPEEFRRAVVEFLAGEE